MIGAISCHRHFPYLLLQREGAGQREHDLRQVGTSNNLSGGAGLHVTEASSARLRG